MTDRLQDLIDYRDALYGKNVIGPKDLIDIRVDALDFLIGEVERLRGLLTELLDAYKAQAGPLVDDREPERYRRWAEELVAKVEAELRRDPAV